MEHEGGIATPMIFNYPPAPQVCASLVRTPAHINDFMPTFLEIAGVDYPSHYNEVELDSLDGESFTHLINSNEYLNTNRSMFWEHMGNRAVRQGNWKLVAIHGKEWELYNINKDLFEKENLINVHPDVAKKLIGKYKTWATKHKVAKWPLTE